jgi:hypothetical protein
MALKTFLWKVGHCPLRRSLGSPNYADYRRSSVPSGCAHVHQGRIFERAGFAKRDRRIMCGVVTGVRRALSCGRSVTVPAIFSRNMLSCSCQNQRSRGKSTAACRPHDLVGASPLALRDVEIGVTLLFLRLVPSPHSAPQFLPVYNGGLRLTQKNKAFALTLPASVRMACRSELVSPFGSGPNFGIAGKLPRSTFRSAFSKVFLIIQYGRQRHGLHAPENQGIPTS